MLDASDFNRLLQQNGLPAVYQWNAETQAAQDALSNTVPVLEAFSRGLKALFVHSEHIGGRDDLASMIASAPQEFGLSATPSPADVKQALVSLLAQDRSLAMYLLPERIEEGADGPRLFPPEEGESVREFWIWYVKTDVFPGPVWILVKRDGTTPAYHYGYM